MGRKQGITQKEQPNHDGDEQEIYLCNSCGWEFVTLKRPNITCPECGGGNIQPMKGYKR